MTRSRDLADELADLIARGTLRAGDRMPSIRRMCRERGMSPATAMRAYESLEARDLIEARPRSGYYVSNRWRQPAAEPRRSRPPAGTTHLDVSELVFDILEASRDRDVVAARLGVPEPDAVSVGEARTLSRQQRAAHGSVEHRRKPAAGKRTSCGDKSRAAICSSARACPPMKSSSPSARSKRLNLSLQTVARPGDTIAIESPAFYACLQAIEAAGMKALEIPTHPREGVDLGALSRAHRQARRARLLVHDDVSESARRDAALGEEARARAKLLARRQIPLIEDDVYAELYFGEDRPKPAKAFDAKGLVLNCGSFSKCLAPGYRLGWARRGDSRRRLQRRKITTTLATSVPIQNGIALMLRQEGYDAHLVKLRQALRVAAERSAAIRFENIFRAAIALAIPDGGYFLWIELAPTVDALEVHRRALQANISIAPGPMFSARREFRNCLRLNYGHPWSAAMDRAVAELGRIIRAVSG